MSTQPGSSQARRQPLELRLAVAFTGGVSLAVWMGGMAREMNLLTSASRARRGEQVAPPGSAAGRQLRDRYLALLDLLDLDCSLDILSGTSAGGINAAVLGMANVRRLDLGGLRDLWFREGSLATLLHDPGEKNPLSLLRGDAGLLAGLRDGLTRLSAAPLAGGAGTDSRPAANPAEDPTKVFITTTLLTGEDSRFTDEYGTLVRDTDHHGLFTFTSKDLASSDVSALALAARCSASFPAAFEPALIPVGTPGGDGHPDMKKLVNTKQAQFAADGGLLANRPLGPALQAVFDRRADHEVRRVLAYVVPLLGADPRRHPRVAPVLADTPGVAPALSADMNAMLSQTISAELAAIMAHNQQVRARRDTRHELARFGMATPRLAARLYPTYRERRAGRVAATAADEVLAQLADAPPASDGRPAGFGADAEHARAEARLAAGDQLPAMLPEAGDYEDMNAAGREALDDAKATVIALLNASHRLLPRGDRPRLGALRRQATGAMPQRAEPTARQTVAAMPAALAPSAAPRAAADAAVALLAANMAVDTARQPPQAPATPAAAAPQPWRDLAEVVLGLRDLLAATPVGTGPDDTFVRDLIGYLTLPLPDCSPATVAARLFDLHVARYVLQPDGLVADQEIELVQMSSDTRTRLDPRTLAGEKLTGLQLHHFGAFYKRSWRANDWMWGRLDGAGWLVHVLLDPRRLRRLADEALDPGAFADGLKLALRDIAGEDAPPGVWDPFPAADGHPGMAAEMAFLTATGNSPLPPSLPWTSMWVATGLQRIIAAEELANVAEQAAADLASGGDEKAAKAFLAAYRDAVAPAANGATAGGAEPAGKSGVKSYPAVPAGNVREVLNACQVSAETFSSELGSPMLTRTITQAAAVTVNVAQTVKALPSFLRPALAGARTVTLLAYRTTTAGPAARYPLLAGLALIAAGALASTSTIAVISAFGLVAVLAGLLLIAAGAGRRISAVAAVVALAAGGALIAAGFIPFIRDHLFPWLEKTAVPTLAKHPALWAILVAFLLLPPVWTIAEMIRRRPSMRSKASR